MVASDDTVRADYFQWLCEKVGAKRDRQSWMLLMRDLHHTAFEWSIDHDENRAKDGEDLRKIFRECSHWSSYEAIEGPCTMLEMLIALAMRMSDAMYDPYEMNMTQYITRTEMCFWEMMSNCHLIAFNDDDYYSLGGSPTVGKILTAINNRTYRKNGEFGLFPLRYSQGDQRKAELWYQMQSYLAERSR